MKLYTVQIAKWRILEKLNLRLFDVTVKSGHQAFAPTYQMVMDHKRKIITDEEYTELYKRMMRTSYVVNKAEWLSIIHEEVVVIGCYCRCGCFCHRYLLVDMFKKLCELHDIPFEYLGDVESICTNNETSME